MRQQNAKVQTCRIADLHTCRRGAIADLPTYILLDFRDFENVTEFNANSVLMLLVPRGAADSLARTVMSRYNSLWRDMHMHLLFSNFNELKSRVSFWKNLLTLSILIGYVDLMDFHIIWPKILEVMTK